MYIINRYPGMMAKKNGHATYPDDFPMLKDFGLDFAAVKEGDNWVIETTLNGDALMERLRQYADMDAEPTAEEIAERKASRKALLEKLKRAFSKKKNSKAYAAIAVMFAVIEEEGFGIYVSDNEDYIEIEAWTPNGVDMIESIDLRDADSISPWAILENFKESVDAFDPDEEVRLHMEDKAFASAFTYRKAADEFEEWETRLQEVAAHLQDAVNDLASIGITEELFEGKKFNLPYAYEVFNSTDTI